MTSRAVPDLDDWRPEGEEGTRSFPPLHRPPALHPTASTASSETLLPLAEAAGRAARHAGFLAKVKIQVTSGSGDMGVTHPLTHCFPLTSPLIVLFIRWWEGMAVCG